MSSKGKGITHIARYKRQLQQRCKSRTVRTCSL